jgi:tetratricopeptide (TPR) repeat protein
MRRGGSPVERAVLLLVLAVATLHARRAIAQNTDTRREAARHFQRGVALYSEADYRGALVEFKRTAALIPNPAVLYNIGETEYQLQEYASALTTFERYLKEAGPSESHRAEVEGNVQVLRARVGHVIITTTPAGADIVLDDQPLGKTPLDKPVRVSIGRRKIVAALAGRLAVTRYVEIAADDVVPVSLQLLPASPNSSPVEPAPTPPQVPLAVESPRASSGPALRTVGWVTTGALAAGAATFGVLALRESKNLKDARQAYPTASSDLDHAARVTTTYSILADALAAGAIVVGGITLYSTLSSSQPAPSVGAVRLSLGFGSANLAGSF